VPAAAGHDIPVGDVVDLRHTDPDGGDEADGPQ